MELVLSIVLLFVGLFLAGVGFGLAFIDQAGRSDLWAEDS